MKDNGFREITVTDREGTRATVVMPAHEAREAVPDRLEVRLETGERCLVDAALLYRADDGRYVLDLNLHDLNRGATDTSIRTIPVVEEQLEIGRRETESGRVRVTKHVHEREELVEQPLYEEELEVRRVPVNRIVSEPATVRQEGDTTIIPVHEEVLVVEKRLRLVEEVHVVRRGTERIDPQRITLRRESIAIDEDLDGTSREGDTSHGASDPR